MVRPPSIATPTNGTGEATTPRRRKRPKPRSSSKLGGRESGMVSPPSPRAPGGDATLQLTHDVRHNQNNEHIERAVEEHPILGDEERRMIAEEKPELRKALEEFRDRAREVEGKISALVSRAAREAEEEPGPREEGASFLAVKQLILISYCRDVCSYAGSKARGQPLEGRGASGRLVELRAVMEKMRPMEKKLKYQMDKLIRVASTPVLSGAGGSAEEGDDPLSYKPRPEAMAPWGEDAGGDESSEDDAKARKLVRKPAASAEADDKGSSLYRAPRLSSVPYDDDGGQDGGRTAKSRHKLKRSEVMETLREEFGDQPETVRPVGKAGPSGVAEAKMRKIVDADRERREFEEDHMVRLTVSRKLKKERTRMERDAGRLETIADVGSAADFVRAARDADGFGELVGKGVDGAKKRKKGGSHALKMAMGAVGKSMSAGRGKSSKRRRN